MRAIALVIVLAAAGVAPATACESACVVEPACALEPAAAEPAPEAEAPPAEALQESVDADAAEADYDPWEPFNERMFWFNHRVLDRFVVKPTATAWSVLPGPAREHLDGAFDNLEMPRRFVNHLLQLRPQAAGTELARFVINTTIGVVGFFDVAGRFRLLASDADAGQTLGFYGVGPGPYLCLPFLPPMTVRDGIGGALDGLVDPVGHFLPFIANQAMSVVRQVNERSLDLELYGEIEDDMLDLYSAARNAYLQRRKRAIDERRAGTG